MTDDKITPEAALQHLDISCNHEAGLIPVSTQRLIRAFAARLAKVAAERDEWHAECLKQNADLFAMIDRVAELEAALAASRSDAINEFAANAGMKGSDHVAALPDDVRKFRLETAVAQMQYRRGFTGGV
jgi:uncharacterized protein YcaQ